MGLGSTGLYIASGLLEGAGKAITDNAEANRQMALERLKREYQIDDRNANNAAEMSRTQAEIQGRNDLVHDTAAENRQTEQVRGEEDRKTEAVKGDIRIKEKAFEVKTDAALKQLQSALDIRKDAWSQKVAADINGGVVDSVKVGGDGTATVFYKDGHSERQTGVKLAMPGGGDDGASITGEQDSRGGSDSPPTPAATKPAGTEPTGAQETARKQALAHLPGTYSQVQQDPERYRTQYPGMFDANGNLLPIGTLKDRINQRYGAQ